MGGAIAVGAAKNGHSVVVADPRIMFAGAWGEGLDIQFTTENWQAVMDADLVIVAVKPWLMEEVLKGVAMALVPGQAVVSIAAGVTFAQLEEYLSPMPFWVGKVGLFRVIPNTAIALGQSTTFISCRNVTQEQYDKVHSLFAPLGKVFDVKQDQMTAVTALASSGIAYALRYMDAAVKGGVEMGLDEKESLRIVLQTVRGAVALLETNGTMPQTEINKVTTPGGITLKGLEAMEQNGFSDAVIKGLLATK